MKYFIDTEFIENGKSIDLISIGIKCEDGRKYHAISSQYNAHLASDWVKENVIQPMYLSEVNEDVRNTLGPLDFHGIIGTPRDKIRDEVLEFVGDDPEFWGYYCDYDWVVFCWLFGKMADLPKGYPMYCRDLKQESDRLGASSLVSPDEEHNALADAEWNERLYNHLFIEKEE